MAEPTGLRVVLSDHTLARYDPATGRLAAAPVGSYPVIQLARVDLAGDRVAARVPLDGRATALAADGDRAWVATTGPNAVLRLPS